MIGSRTGRAGGRAAMALLLLGLAGLPASPVRAQTAATSLPATPSPVADPSAPITPTQTVNHGLFSDVQLYRPAGAVRQFVMLASFREQPNAAERRMIRTMTGAGALVAFVPIEPFYRKLEAQGGACLYAGGAFENLSRQLQAFEQLPTYVLPMLVGSGRAASFVYAVLAQTPAGIFGSALSVGFCPAMPTRTPLCPTNLLRWRAPAEAASASPAAGAELLPSPATLAAPWDALQSSTPACTPGAAADFVAKVPGARWVPLPPNVVAEPPPAGAAVPSELRLPPTFDAAYTQLASRHVALAPPPAQLANLPVVELPVPGAGARFVVLLSGDGGWAGIDKGIAAALVDQGIPVAGFDSLRYFWSARTPEGLAADLDRLIRYYAARWKRSEVILIGYSQGADVLPFAINRLPPATRSLVRLTALLGLGQKASFEFHLGNWIGSGGDLPIAPEARQLSAAGTLCVYGQAEKDSLCPSLAPDHVRPVPLAGGHHFGGDYPALATMILKAAPPVERR